MSVELWIEARAWEWELRRAAVLACKVLTQRKHGRQPTPEELTAWLGDTDGMGRPDPRVDQDSKRARAPRGRYRTGRRVAAVHRVSTFEISETYES